MTTERSIIISQATVDEINRAFAELVRMILESAGVGQSVSLLNDVSVAGTISADANLRSGTLTGGRLLASDPGKRLVSVASLTSWIAGTANQITVTSDGDGTITLSAPQNLHTGATPTFATVKIPAADHSATILHGMGNPLGL